MKRIFNQVLTVIFLTQMIGQAYPQKVQWAIHAGGVGMENGTSSVVDNSGNIYYTGTYKSTECFFITDTLSQLGYNGMFIAKYSPEGNELWVKGFGDNNDDNAQAITDLTYSPASDKIYFIGCIYRIGHGTRNFVAKLNATGNVIWMKTFPGVTSSSSFKAITLDENENIYITGSISTTVMFDTIQVQAGGIVAKFDSSGNCIWVKKKFGFNQVSSSQVETFGIKVRNKKIFVSGYMAYDGIIFIDTMKISHKGLYSSLICCFDSACKIQWITEGISKMTYSYSNIAIDNASNIYYTGCFRDTISFPGNILTTWPGRKDMFLVKLDKNGIVKWVTQTRSSVAEGVDIISNDKGNSYATGYFKGEGNFGNFSISSISSKDMFLAGYDSTGTCQGVINFANGNGNGLSQDVHGNPCFMFLFGSTTTVGQNTFSSYGSSDFIFAKCSAITGIEEPKINLKNQLVIYANPTTGKCTITIPEELINEKYLTLQVFDSQGKLIQQAPVEKVDGKIKLNIEAQARGTYTALLANRTKSYSGKIIFR
ncbi:MAG: T9SS type A sorting domain-containing protein [Bacteroidetes bacterium]|nr:T9SS type A sorting domain-containing protein [Bacteroidota bacterium]